MLNWFVLFFKTKISEWLYNTRNVFFNSNVGVFFRELEGTVEELRGNVINRKTRVNMSDVENMALILSKSRYVPF